MIKPTYRIELHKTNTSLFRRLMGTKQEYYMTIVSTANGQVLFTSQNYSRKQTALDTKNHNFPTIYLVDKTTA